MNWNHRLVDMTDEKSGEQLYAIREVHYNDDGKPMGHTEPFMCAENMDAINELLDRLEEAVKKPTLKPEDFTGEAK